ncbi:Epsin-3, clathrin recruitment and traffic between the Golgi and endosome [Coniosporium tulheliwenetii]|uniref:Epsin-3, clathrin recruitment and traffic between the Golgi and endosome n=1 Tax=Coniosporium tulheliwenetii TaxID=3383036 RepID=A0ACC2YMB9_9PEZI|nr:Epsin-3, clathrin recruitment and traffic between the Golgi and endosome [Cladosporium sp. JES 115]
MPMIYKRFTEKAAEEWRQIYKALQLLEFLIKNGSERVIDDARSHLSLLKMLRQFHYIDQNGKDQGINVRNRSKELAELLSDVDRIRAERKKARATKNKYGGVEGGSGFSTGMSGGGSRYGGFGSEEQSGYGGYSGGVYGDGGGFGGNSSGFSDTLGRRDKFEEYDEYDEGAAPASGRRKQEAPPTTTKREPPTKAEPPKPKEPEVDLFSFGDDEPAAPISTSNGKQPATSNDFGALQSSGADDDDFDDFQSAAPSTQKAPSIPAPAPTSFAAPTTQYAAPQPRAGTNNANFADIFNTRSPAPMPHSPPPLQQAQPIKPSGYQASQPNYFTSVPLAPATSTQSPTTSTTGLKSPIGAKPAVGTAKAGGDAFSDLLAGTSIKKAGTPTKGLTMADMAKQKSSAGIWGAPAPSTSSPAARPGQTGGAKTGGSALDDLLG